MKRLHGIVKASGVVFCIVGVIVLTFYQGPELKSFNHHQLFHQNSEHHATFTSHPTATWILGIFFMSLGIAFWAPWTVLQGPILDAYPSKLLNTTLQIMFATIQCFMVALAAERDFSRWKLGLDICLVGVLNSGILVSGIGYYMQVWVIDKCGPVFLSITTPITLLVTVMLCSLIGEAVALGSVLSGAIMCAGLYCVIWAKRAEQIDVSKQMSSPVQETEV